MGFDVNIILSLVYVYPVGSFVFDIILAKWHLNKSHLWIMSFIWIILQSIWRKTSFFYFFCLYYANLFYKLLEICFECSINLLILKYHKFFQEWSSMKVIIGLNSTCENKHYANNKILFLHEFGYAYQVSWWNNGKNK